MPRLVLLLGLLAQSLVFATPSAYAVAPGNEVFERTWVRTDAPVLSGAVSRTWMWGPAASSAIEPEPYLEAPNGSRDVQYFDKSRMEDNRWRTTEAPWDVTNGLLVVELITGQLQIGDNTFLPLPAASVPVAGDPTDPNGPTYATFSELLDAEPATVGSIYTARLDRNANIVAEPGLASRNVTAAIIDDITDHAIATPFWNFMNSSGLVQVGETLVVEPLFENPYYATGRPITEAYWAWVEVGGTPQDVLLQCFERRCLTYTPGNEAAWQVEAGNVGQHYAGWRDGNGQLYATVWATVEDGGSVSLDGVTIDVSAGALSRDTLVTIVTSMDLPAPPDGYVPVGDAWLLGLSDATLSEPIEVTLPYEAGLVPGDVGTDEVVAGRFSNSGPWVLLPGDVDNDSITVETTTLSIWQPFAPEEGDGTGPDPDPDPSATPTVPGGGGEENSPPVANDQDVTTPEDTPVAITLTGSDADDDSLTFEVLTQPEHGTLSGTAPNLTYTPDANYHGPDSFTFRVNDGTVNSVSATVDITVTPVNDAPVAEDQSVTTAEDTPVDITLVATDVDGDTLTYAIASQPEHGTLSGTAPHLTYTPDQDYTGADSFTFTANDGTVDSNVATVSITVTEENDAPVADDQSLTTPEDTPLPVTLTASDIDGDDLTYAVTGGPANGTLSGTAPNLTYTPDLNYFGPDSFTFVANDGLVDSNTATISITVTPVNDAPTASDQSVTVLEDVPTTITLTGSDVDNDPLTYSVGDQPANGTLSGTAPNLTYTPDPFYFGPDSFTFVVNDGTVDSTVATVTIDVLPVNNAPMFTPGADIDVLEDSGAYSASWASNMSAGPANEAGQTTHFEATVTSGADLFSVAPAIDASGNLTFTSAPDAFGVATVEVTLVDDGGTANGGDDTSAVHTLTITIDPVNDVPSFTKGPDVTVAEDSAPYSQAWATAISAGPANESGQTLTFEITANDNTALFSVQPAVSAAGVLSFTLTPDANGSALVTLRISDDGGTADGGVDTSAEQTFTITVEPVNDAPSFTSGGDVTVLEDSGAYSAAWASAISPGPADEAGQSLTFTITGNDNESLFSVQPAIAPDGTLTFTPAGTAFGAASITVELSDDGGTANGGEDTSAPVTFVIHVTPVNHAPSFTTGADQTVLEDAGPQTVDPWATGISAGPPNESDQTVAFQITDNTNPGLFSAGPAVSPSGVLTYTPAADANGAATITLVITDDGGTANGGNDTSAPQSFSITVTAVNDAPTFTPGADVTVLEDSGPYSQTWATDISPGPADESGQTVQFTVGTPSNPGLFSVQPSIAADGTLTFTPAPDAFGEATVEVTLSDTGGTANGGSDTSATHTLTITVSAVNDAPVLDLDGNTVPVEDSATLQYPATAVLLAPDALVTDIDSPDLDGGSLTVSIAVGTATDQLYLGAGFTLDPDDSVRHTGTDTVIGQIDGTDNGFGGADLLITLNANATPAIVSQLVAAITYFSSVNPPADLSDRVITLTVVDGDGDANGGADTASATVTVIHNQPPTAQNTSATTLEDTAVTVTLTATDPEQDPLTFAIASGPSNGALGSIGVVDCTTLPGTCTATVQYTPDPDYNGSDSFTYTANDGGSTSDPATASITITPVNDAPTFTASNQTVAEDSGPHTVANWAAFDPGPANESTQTVLGYTVSNVANSGLFSVLPAVSTDGTLTYTLAANANGASTFDVTVQDSGGTASGGVDTSAPQTFTITVTAVNDAPEITAPAATQTVAEDTDLIFSGASLISVTDIDAGSNAIEVSLAVTNGTLTLSGVAGLTFSAGGNGQASMTFTGTQAAINTALSGLVYRGAQDYHGPDTLIIDVDDLGHTGSGGPLADSATIAITVTPVNDAPVLANIESAGLAYLEGAPATVITSTITITDIDSTTLTGATVTVSSGYVNGEDVLAFVNTGDITGVFTAGTGVLTLTGTATLAQYQTALRTVTYQNLSDNPGLTKTITFQVNDGEAANNMSNEVSRDIAITAVNDAPVVTAPAATQTVAEDTNLVFNAANSNLISVADVDAGSNPVQVTLTAANGTVTLSGTAGLTIAGGANGTSTVTFTGTLANINTALNGLIYRGHQDFNSTRGAASLTIEVNDLGNTGTGGALTDSDTVAITVTAVNDPPVVPTRTFDAQANLTLTINDGTTQGGNLLVGVSDPDTGDSGYTAVFTASLVAGTVSPADASVTVAANGDLTVTPPAGYTGDLTFTYQVCDNGNPVSVACNTASVTVTVSGPVVWFINGSAAAGGTGTLSSPFQSITAFNAATTGDNQYIFVFSGAYTGSLALRSGQQLWGRGAFASGDLTQISGITAPPAGSQAYPTFNNIRPTLTNGGSATAHSLTLHNSNTVRGLNLTSATATYAALGASGRSGTTTIQDVTITASGGGHGVALTNQSGTLNLTNAPISVTGGAGNALRLDQGSAAITFDATSSITQGGTGRAIHITGRTAGAVTFNGTVTATSANNQGVLLATNGTSTFNFTNTIQIANGATDVFTATGSGTVIATNAANTLSASGVAALRIENVTIGTGGLVFRSISANGGTNGIVLNNTGSTAGLTVTGNSAGLCGGQVGSGPPAAAATATAPNSADCTGGVIQNTTGAGIVLSNTRNVSLTRVRVAGAGDDGIQGTSVTNFTLNASLIENNGNAVGEANIDFGDSADPTPDGLFGTASITNSTVRDAFYLNVVIRNQNNTLALTVTGSQFRNNSANAQGEDGILLDIVQTGTVTANVTGNYFAANRGDHFQAAGSNSAVLNVTFKNNTLTGGHADALGQGITISAATGVAFGGYTGRIDYDIDGNHVQGAILSAITVNLGTSGPAGVFSGFIRNNVLGTTGVALSCSAQANGITIDAHGNGTHTSVVSNNTLRQCFDQGISVLANDGNGVLNLTVTGNDIREIVDDSNGGRWAFFLNAGSADPNIFGLADSHTVCLNLGGAGALANYLDGGPISNEDFRVRQRFNTTIILPGYAGSDRDTGAVIAYIISRNNGTAPLTGSSTVVATGGGYVNGPSCATP